MYYKSAVIDFSFWALFGGILGARIVYVLVEWRYFFIIKPWIIVFKHIKIPSVLVFWEGGLVVWGGILGGICAFIWFALIKNINVFILGDILILGLPIGQSIGRIGCIYSGCCWGKSLYHLNSHGLVISDFSFSICLSFNSIAYKYLSMINSKECYLMNNMTFTIPLYPIQLMESILNFIIFLILSYIYTNKLYHGSVMLYYFILYSIFRFICEFYRNDISRGFFIYDLISTSQFISIVVFFMSIIFIFMFKYHNIIKYNFILKCKR